MSTDNVDLFKKVVFSIPSFRELLSLITASGVFYGLVTYFSLEIFAGNLFKEISILVVPLSALLLYILPTVVSGEALKRFLPNYPREWGYFLGMCNQLILFIYMLLLTGADSFASAWNIVWMALITLYLSNLVVLLLTVGHEYVKRLSALSSVHPLLVLAVIHLSVGRLLEIPLEVYAWNFLLLPLALVILLFAMALNEYLLKANVPGISSTELTSALFQKKQYGLDLGYCCEPVVQNLEVVNKSGNFSFSVPWIHPGPLEGFGGGRLTSEIIEELNENGEGFFLHFPTTHKSDPADPEDYKKILDAMEEPEKDGNASKLHSKGYEELTLHGRKIGGQKIVFMEHDEFDDYEVQIVGDMINEENVTVVDLHNHPPKKQADRQELWSNTVQAEELRENLSNFINWLEELEEHDYSAGKAVSLEGTPISALVEEVDGQKTLLFGIEGNEATQELKELEEEFEEVFDELLLFTTDTHQSIHQLSSNHQVEKDRVRETVKEAANDISEASIGFSSARASEMRLLQEDYSGLIFSVNILVRSLALTLILVYLGLLIWVF